MGDGVRTRFAPAPSGYVHLGNARTALFSWLFARHHDGEFVLRIDDTDPSRSTAEAIKVIIDSFRWLGLDWNEGPEVGGAYGPYFQSQRGKIYADYAAKLLESGAAYLCFCTPEELEAERQAARAEKRAYVYSGRCGNLSETDRRRFESEGRKPVIRVRMGEGVIVVNDLIKGKVEFRRELMSDEIVVRSDGRAMYNFASAVDDVAMKITHVIRADEHLSNTPKQMAVFEALGVKPPEFGHVPMVLAPGGGKKMSKREGAVSLEWYREQGYLPSALRNYLARLGWSLDDKTELIDDDQIIKGFSLGRVSVSAGALDPDKLLWMNAEYLKRLSTAERTDEVLSFLHGKGLMEERLTPERRKWLENVVEAVGDRLKVLSDVIQYAEFLLVEDLKYDEKSVERRLMKEGTAAIIGKLKETLSDAEPFTESEVEKAVRNVAEECGVSGSDVIHPLRVAITGKAVGPGIFESVTLLGKEKTLRRLEQTLECLGKGTFPLVDPDA